MTEQLQPTPTIQNALEVLSRLVGYKRPSVQGIREQDESYLARILEAARQPVGLTEEQVRGIGEQVAEKVATLLDPHQLATLGKGGRVPSTTLRYNVRQAKKAIPGIVTAALNAALHASAPASAPRDPSPTPWDFSTWGFYCDKCHKFFESEQLHPVLMGGGYISYEHKVCQGPARYITYERPPADSDRAKLERLALFAFELACRHHAGEQIPFGCLSHAKYILAAFEASEAERGKS